VVVHLDVGDFALADPIVHSLQAVRFGMIVNICASGYVYLDPYVNR
jgi:hypothetical protein